jgi:hypothetical protein
MSILGVSCHFKKYFSHSQTCCSDHICEFEPSSWQGEVDTTLCDKVCQWLATGLWFSLGTPVSSTNNTNRHDITEILLKMASTSSYIVTIDNSSDLVLFCLVLWCWRHFQQYFSYIMAISFIDEGNRSTQIISQTCRKSLTNVIT